MTCPSHKENNIQKFNSTENTSGRFRIHHWDRAEQNPVLCPGPDDFDSRVCMNPYVVRWENKYWLFYGSCNSKSQRNISLASASLTDPMSWIKHGPVLELGRPGNFDEFWCVLPCIHRFGDRWHLYYTGRHSRRELGLQSFTGIGLAASDDLRHWRKISEKPLIKGDGFSQWPDNQGIAGGGNILEIPQPDGRILYRMYYTLAVGIPNQDLFVDQAKYSVVAHSYDGIEWFDKKVVLSPRLETDYENIATIGLNVWKTAEGYRAIYAGIGTRFGAYSICEAESADGLNWYRGNPGENLSLPPTGAGWESQMTEYPNIIAEGNRLRLFYCGNGYGRTGIGTALAYPVIHGRQI